jgi:hypothetical protein
MAKETSSTIRILFQPLIVGSILAAMLFAETADVTVSRSSLVFAEANSDDFDTVSGKLDQVNVAEKKGTITTDLGKQVVFQITKPELFLNLSPGQRVTLKLDKQGRAVRVMDNAAPELPPPSTGPR